MYGIEVHLDDINKFEHGKFLKITVAKHLRQLTNISLNQARDNVNGIIDNSECIELEVDDTTNLVTNPDASALLAMGLFIKGTSDYHVYKGLLQPIIDKAISEDRMCAATHLIDALKDIKANKI